MNDPILIGDPNPETDSSYTPPTYHTKDGDLVSHNKPLTIVEGSETVITNDFLLAVDSDNSTDQRQFRILTVPEHGKILLSGKVVGANSTFTQEDIDAGRVIYAHDGSEYDDDKLVFEVSDGVLTTVHKEFQIKILHHRNDIAEVTVTEKINHFDEELKLDGHINITDTDLIPHISDKNEDFVRVTINVKDDTLRDYVIFKSPSSEVIYDPSVQDSSESGVYQKAGTIVFQGKIGDVQAAINNTVFTTKDNVDLDAKIILEVSIDDRLRNEDGSVKTAIIKDVNDEEIEVEVANGGNKNIIEKDGDLSYSEVNAANNIITKEIAVYSSTYNDKPTFDEENSLHEDAIAVVKEDQWSNIGKFVVVDEDSVIGKNDDDFGALVSNNQVTVQVSSGKLRFGDSGNESQSITFTGSLARINSQLAQIQYLSVENFNNDITLDDSVTDNLPQVTVTFTDKSGHGVSDDAKLLQIVRHIYLKVEPQNDAPEIFGGPAESELTDINEHPSVIIDGPYTFSTANNNAITIGDDNDFIAGTANFAAQDNYKVTITLSSETSGVNVGQLVFTNSAITVEESSTNHTYVLQGTREQINNALDGMRYEGIYNQSAQVKLHMVVDDFGNGDKAVHTEELQEGSFAEKDFYFILNESNNAPTVTAKDVVIAVAEDSTSNKIFVGEDNKALFSFTDIDAFDTKTNYVEITLGTKDDKLKDADLGTLACKAEKGASVENVTDDNNNVIGIRITGTIDAINKSIANVTYTTPSNLNIDNGVGRDELNINILYNDNGNTTKIPVGDTKNYEETVELDYALNITPVNDAPIVIDAEHKDVDAKSPLKIDLTHIKEDTTADDVNTYKISDWVSQYFSDKNDAQVHVDNTENNFVGIVVYANAATAAQGVWQYKNGDSWVEIATDLSDTNGLFLSKDAEIRFIPVANFNGTPGALIAHIAESDTQNSDETTLGTGNVVDVSAANIGGTTIFSSNSVQLGIVVDAVNDAPNPDGLGDKINLTSIDEDTTKNPGQKVSDLIKNFDDKTDNVTAAEDGSKANTFEAIVITNNKATSEQGTWQYYNGTKWVDIGTDVTEDKALVIDVNTKLRFNPSQDYNGTPGDLSYVIAETSDTDTKLATGQEVNVSSDNRGGTTRYSEGIGLIGIEVKSVNDAPVIKEQDATTISVDEDGTVTFKLGTVTVTDVDVKDAATDKYKVVISIGHGTIGLAEGSSFSDKVTFNKTNTQISAELTLAEVQALLNEQYSYKPVADFNGKDKITIKVTDAGADGDETLKTFTFNKDITVNAVNDAPNSKGVNDITLNPINEDPNENSGQVVSTLVTFEDSKDQVKGGSSANKFEAIVITNNKATSEEGTWQYYDGTKWVDIGTNVTENAALVIAADTKLRFNPSQDYNGTPGDLSYVIAETSDTDTKLATGQEVNVSSENRGGTTRYSADTGTITISVTSVSDAPEFIKTDVDLSVTEDKNLKTLS